MTKGIVLDKCSDVLIDSCSFENLDIAIEAKKSRNIRLTRNKIKHVDPRVNQLLRKINESSLSLPTKKELNKDIIRAVILGQERRLDAKEERNILVKIRSILGKGAWELTKAIIADVLAGKILIKIANPG